MAPLRGRISNRTAGVVARRARAVPRVKFVQLGTVHVARGDERAVWTRNTPEHVGVV